MQKFAPGGPAVQNSLACLSKRRRQLQTLKSKQHLQPLGYSLQPPEGSPIKFRFILSETHVAYQATARRYKTKGLKAYYTICIALNTKGTFQAHIFTEIRGASGFL